MTPTPSGSWPLPFVIYCRGRRRCSHCTGNLGTTVRFVTLDGAPWAVAADACRCLDLNVANGTGPALRGLDPAERQTFKTPESLRGNRRGNPNVTVISTSGLFKLVLRAQRSNPTPSTFDFNGQPIRVEDRKGTLWFLGMDPCAVLGFDQPATAYARLDNSEKCYLARTKVGMKPGRPLIAISESGLYKLILASRKPEAKPFQDWVTKVVLPALRRDGMYVVGEEKVAAGLTAI